VPDQHANGRGVDTGLTDGSANLVIG